MKKWSLIFVALLIALLPFTSTAYVNAQEDQESGLTITKTQDKTSASPHEVITYTYTITNTSDVTINNLVLNDSKLGEISLTSTTLEPGQSLTVTATYTVTISDLPGPITNTATVQGEDPDANTVSATSSSVSTSLTINKNLLTKSEVLQLSGVPGRGISTAPGLQKPFNPKSQAAEHAGKNENGGNNGNGGNNENGGNNGNAGNNEHAGKKK